jgi:hypothetical protein
MHIMNLDLHLFLIYGGTLVLIDILPIFDTVSLFDQQYVLTPMTQLLKSKSFSCSNVSYYL